MTTSEHPRPLYAVAMAAVCLMLALVAMALTGDRSAALGSIEPPLVLGSLFLLLFGIAATRARARTWAIVTEAVALGVLATAVLVAATGTTSSAIFLEASAAFLVLVHLTQLRR